MASKTPLLQPAQGSTAWNEPLNANFQTVTNALGNILSVSASSGYSFNSDDTVNLGFILTGSVGSSQNVTIPNSVVGSWIVVNATSGAGSITFKTVSGTGVQLSSGATILYSDGTNVYSAIAGSGASYLPTSGGTISGNLSITGTLDVAGLSTLGNTSIPAGKTLTIETGATFALNGAFSPSYIALGGSQVSPYLLTLTGGSAGSSMAYMNGLVSIPSGTGNGLQIGTTDGIGTNRLVVNGTSNFIGNVSIAQNYGLTINSGGTTSGTNRLAVTGDASISGALTVGSFTPATISAGTVTGTTSVVSNGTMSAATGFTANGTVRFNQSGGLTTFTTKPTFSAGAGFSADITLSYGAPQSLLMANTNGVVYGQFYGNLSTVGFSYTGANTCYLTAAANSGVYGTGPYNNASDIKLKENIVEITDATEIVKKLRGVYFNMIGNPKRQVGFIAQEVEPHLPEIVTEDDETKFVSYANLVGVLVESIKELEARIAELEAKTS